MKKIIQTFTIKSSTVDTDNFTLEALFSNEKEDRHGEKVMQNWDLKSFRKNPVLLNSHNYGDVSEVIGKISKIASKDKELTGKVHFAVNENPKAKIIFDLYAGGYLNAFSVGFVPKDFSEDGMTIMKAELLEISAVSVPANALALAKSKGIEVDKLYDKSNDSEDNQDKDPDGEDAEDGEDNKDNGGEGDPGTDNGGREGEDDSEDSDSDEGIKDESPTEGSPDEHSCEVREPKKYEKLLRRKCYKQSGGKCIDYVFGISEKNEMEVQSLKYPKNDWKEFEARENASRFSGKFIPATKLFGQDTWDDSGNVISLKVRDIDEFEPGTFEKVALKSDIPRINAIIATIKGGEEKLIQSLFFPKEDGWTLDDAKKWFIARQMEILNLIPRRAGEKKGCGRKPRKPRKSINEIIQRLGEEINVETRLKSDRAKKKRIIQRAIRNLIKAKQDL